MRELVGARRRQTPHSSAEDESSQVLTVHQAPVTALYRVYLILTTIWLSWWLSGNKTDPGSMPGSGRSPGKGNGFPLQYSCLGNPMDRGAWRATVHGIARVGHDSATKPPPPPYKLSFSVPLPQIRKLREDKGKWFVQGHADTKSRIWIIHLTSEPKF